MTGAMIEVTVLTQAHCRFCEHAVAVLERVGADYPFTLRHIDLDSDDGRALAARHGVLFAPGILLDGEMFSYGRLSERRLRRHLSHRATPTPSAPDHGPPRGGHPRAGVPMA